MTRRKSETEQEYYARRRDYFRKYYEMNREARLKYQEDYYQRPGVKERVQEYGRERYQATKAVRCEA
jgi:hypothetical protein